MNKKNKPVNIERLEYMQRLLNNKTAFLSDDVVEKIHDLWSESIGREQRQALYRYWLGKYVQLLKGYIAHSLEHSPNLFSIDKWFRLNEQYDENHRSMQGLWLTNDRVYMENAFM